MVNWNLISGLKRFDAYPKTLEDFRIQTKSGGILTIISAIVMILLFTSEIRDYLTPQIKEELFVDTSRTGKLKINFDIVFSTISCDFLGIDAMDASGEAHNDIVHNIYKRRLDLTGQPIEDPQREQVIQGLGETKKIINSTKVSTESSADSQNDESKKDETTEAVIVCGSCYGAETPEKKCCSTCAEVSELYRKRNWKFDPRGVEQCKDGDSYSEAEKRALSEGCQIYGFLEVNRVGGSFHVAPGKSFSINHVHVHDVQPFSSSDFNVTHRIRHMSFGPKVDGQGNPLDGVIAVADKGAMMFQYYIKIVPTTYARLDGSIFQSSQFSVTRHSKAVSVMSGESGMPGVFFHYELAPVMVKYSEKERSFGHFATGLCAIIGGVFTVAGLIDKLVYTSSKIIQQKIEIGKLT